MTAVARRPEPPAPSPTATPTAWRRRRIPAARPHLGAGPRRHPDLGEHAGRRRPLGRRRQRPGPHRLGHRPHGARPADRPGRRGPAADPGAADGPDPDGRAGLRPGRAGPPAPAGRVHVVQPDGRPHRPHHARLRGPGTDQRVRRGLGPRRRLPRHAARRRRDRAAPARRRDQHPQARRKLRYESWHLLHLYAYLGVGLALPHQLWTGQEFLSSTGRHGLLVDALGRRGRRDPGLAGRGAALPHPAPPAARRRRRPGERPRSCRSG